jgi:hypothetical protein
MYEKLLMKNRAIFFLALCNLSLLPMDRPSYADQNQEDLETLDSITVQVQGGYGRQVEVAVRRKEETLLLHAIMQPIAACDFVQFRFFLQSHYAEISEDGFDDCLDFISYLECFRPYSGNDSLNRIKKEIEYTKKYKKERFKEGLL